MANALYGLGLEAFLEGAINWTTAAIHVMLIRTVQGPNAGGNAVYSVNLNNDQFLSAVPNNTYCRVVDIALTGESGALGVANASGVTYTSVASGDAIQAIIIYVSTGVDGTSKLIAYIDTATNLPVTPNGGNISIAWDTGANKVFKL